MRALVCGGRDYHDEARVFCVLDTIEPSAVCHGGASGADTLAGLWAKVRGVDCVVYHAQWKEHGRKAGPLRNAAMLEGFKPDIVIAFPGGRGTADMVGRARAASVKVLEVMP